jgi:hypothetical protein
VWGSVNFVSGGLYDKAWYTTANSRKAARLRHCRAYSSFACRKTCHEEIPANVAYSFCDTMRFLFYQHYDIRGLSEFFQYYMVFYRLNLAGHISLLE